MTPDPENAEKRVRDELKKAAENVQPSHCALDVIQDRISQVRELCTERIMEGRLPADIRAEVGYRLGIFIGQGGGGPDKSIPPCPVCGAHGGGGHGGFCPVGA